MVREKVREKSLLSKPGNCQGLLTSDSQGILQFKPKSGNFEKKRVINCQTTMNTNILSPIACPYELITEVKF